MLADGSLAECRTAELSAPLPSVSCRTGRSVMEKSLREKNKAALVGHQQEEDAVQGDHWDSG